MMNENITLKATVTGKRQITIPKEICELLNIETGKQVIFKKEGNKIIFEVEQEYQTCFACNGATRIEGKECFICRGIGKLERDIFNDIYKLIGMLSIHSREYGVAISFTQSTLDEKGKLNYLDFPIVKLISKEYFLNELQRIQDEIQKLIIEQFSPRSIENKSLFCTPSDPLLSMILDTLSTEEAKKEVTKWFRYEKTI